MGNHARWIIDDTPELNPSPFVSRLESRRKQRKQEEGLALRRSGEWGWVNSPRQWENQGISDSFPSPLDGHS